MSGYLQQPLTEHAFMSPSNPHWLNYSKEKLVEVWKSRTNKELGTRLHIFAQECIALGMKLDPLSHPTVATFVNDAIDIGMHSEIHLEYDCNCFGTADALLFAHNVLHIWDLKTGENRVHNTQLLIYAALFCLQNGISPYDITFDLRIYQHGKRVPSINYPDRIGNIMNTIISYSALIEEQKKTIRY